MRICDEKNEKRENLMNTSMHCYEWDMMILTSRVMLINQSLCKCVREMVCVLMICISRV
jgi:hypothetical protein